MSKYKLDIKDTIYRLRGVGNQINLSENSNFVKIVNALTAIERARLDRSVEKIKKSLSDWAGNEIDTFWGSILNLQRLPGIEDVNEVVGDPTYLERIEKFMISGNEGVSIESIRIAAESGAGVSFKAYSSEGRVVLIPSEEINAAQKQGAIKAAFRVAPASAIIDIEDSESFSSKPLSNYWSDSVYVGENPQNPRLSGPDWNSPNAFVSAGADVWTRASETSIAPGDGTPSNLVKPNGSWHVGDMGFGQKANLELSLEKNSLINRIKFSLSPGKWRYVIFIKGKIVSAEIITVQEWETVVANIDFVRTDEIDIEFTNASQNLSSLFVKSPYVGSKVNTENREEWLSLGGNVGVSPVEKVFVASPSNMISGNQWMSSPKSSSDQRVDFYAKTDGDMVSAFTFKTTTSGALFKVAYSLDNIKADYQYPQLNWIETPGWYKLRNGRVDVKPFKGKHVKLTFTKLRPMLLKEYPDADS